MIRIGYLLFLRFGLLLPIPIKDKITSLWKFQKDLGLLVNQGAKLLETILNDGHFRSREMRVKFDVQHDYRFCIYWTGLNSFSRRTIVLLGKPPSAMNTFPKMATLLINYESIREEIVVETKEELVFATAGQHWRADGALHGRSCCFYY
jgi:hypothetical protein